MQFHEVAAPAFVQPAVTVVAVIAVVVNAVGAKQVGNVVNVLTIDQLLLPVPQTALT